MNDEEINNRAWDYAAKWKLKQVAFKIPTTPEKVIAIMQAYKDGLTEGINHTKCNTNPSPTSLPESGIS